MPSKIMDGLVLLFVLLLNNRQNCHALRDVRVTVPVAVVRGDDAILECRFDLEGDQLYSVKWYRGTTEFYRYTPNERPPIKQFGGQTTGGALTVREQDSSATRIVLEHVPRSVTGRYSCEVTADQPSFFTDVQSGFMNVVDLPQRDPEVTGLKTRYKLGDNLKANCTSALSNPAANLTWYINGSPVDGSYVHRHRPRLSADGLLYTAISVLRLTVAKAMFAERGGRLKVRCVARIFDIYYRSHEKSVEMEREHKRHRHHQQPQPPGVGENGSAAILHTSHPPPPISSSQWERRPSDSLSPDQVPKMPSSSPGANPKTMPLLLLVSLVCYQIASLLRLR